MSLTPAILKALAVTLFPLLATAQKPPSPPEKKPQFIENPGEPIRALFSDGRVSELRILSVPAKSYEVSFTVNESTCGNLPKKQVSCSLATPVRLEKLAMIWTEHGSPERKGKPVIADEFPLEFGEAWNIVHKSYATALFADLAQPELSCDSFEWLPRHSPTREAPAAFDFVNWGAEQIRTNPDTGISENTTVSGANGLHWKRFAPNKLRLEAVDSWFGPSPSDISRAFTSGDVVGVVAKDESTQQLCQITLKPDFPAFQSQLAEDYRNATGEYQRYVLGQDQRYEFSSLARLILPIIHKYNSESVFK